MSKPFEITAYEMDPETFLKLRYINDRLFSPHSLSPDDKRDLANAMFVILYDDIHPVYTTN